MAKRTSYAATGLVRAEAKHVRASARKVRLVLEGIRGQSVVDARKQLLFSPRAAAKDVELVLRSAVSNAEVNHGLSPDDLVVAEAFANEGVTIKRFKPRARGRASRINKRTSHITVVLRSLTDVAPGGEETAAAPKQASSDSARAKRVAASRKADGAEVETAAAETATAEVAEAPKKPRAPRKAKADATTEAAADATAEKPAAKKPAAKKPAADKPAAEKKPAAKKPAAKKPAAEKPATDEEKD